MRIGVLGCCHGELDRIYDTVRKLERQSITIDLLICCGDFMSIRDEQDLENVYVPPQYRDMKDFQKYYTGRAEAPVTTVFIGGRNEASNLLREHYFGGWVAPRIYYLGCAGVVRIGPLRIAGISGNFVASDYFRGRHECPPFTEEQKRSAVHARESDAARLEKLQEPVDIVISYDWPRGIWKFGDYGKMCEQQDLSDNLKREMEGNTLGSPAAMELLKKLRPPFWFSSSLQVKFPALVPHGDGTFTRFLALDRCRGGRDYLQVLDIDPRSPTATQALPRPVWLKTPGLPRLAVPLCYDPEWLAVQKVNHESISFSWQPAKAKLVPATKDEVDWVKKRLKDDVGAVPSYRGRRHPNLMPTKLRKSQGAGRQTFQNFSTLQLRELYEFRGLEFPGHLDKPSMIKKLEEYDAFHGEEEFGDEQKVLQGEGFPIPLNFEANLENPRLQRRRLLATLELHDVWKDQEEQRRQVLRSALPEEAYDPFSDEPEVALVLESTVSPTLAPRPAGPVKVEPSEPDAKPKDAAPQEPAGTAEPTPAEDAGATTAPDAAQELQTGADAAHVCPQEAEAAAETPHSAEDRGAIAAPEAAQDAEMGADAAYPSLLELDAAGEAPQPTEAGIAQGDEAPQEARAEALAEEATDEPDEAAEAALDLAAEEQLRASAAASLQAAAAAAPTLPSPAPEEEAEDYAASAAALAAAVMELAESFQEGDDPGPLMLAVDRAEGVLEALAGEEVTEDVPEVAAEEEVVDGFAALAKALAEAEREEAEAAAAAAVVVVDADAPVPRKRRRF